MRYLFLARSTRLSLSDIVSALLVLFTLSTSAITYLPVTAQQSTPVATPTSFRAASNSPIEITHVGQLQEIRSFKIFEAAVVGLAFRPSESKLIVSGLGNGGSSIKLADAEAGEVYPEFFTGERRGDLIHMALSPDGKILAGSSSNVGLSLWNAATGEFINRLGWTIQPRLTSRLTANDL